MESIPEKYFSRKDEPAYFEAYESDNTEHGNQDAIDGYSDPDLDRHLYGSDNSVEGGDVFYPDDFC